MARPAWPISGPEHTSVSIWSCSGCIRTHPVRTESRGSPRHRSTRRGRAAGSPTARGTGPPPLRATQFSLLRHRPAEPGHDRVRGGSGVELGDSGHVHLRSMTSTPLTVTAAPGSIKIRNENRAVERAPPVRSAPGGAGPISSRECDRGRVSWPRPLLIDAPPSLYANSARLVSAWPRPTEVVRRQGLQPWILCNGHHARITSRSTFVPCSRRRRRTTRSSTACTA